MSNLFFISSPDIKTRKPPTDKPSTPETEEPHASRRDSESKALENGEQSDQEGVEETPAINSLTESSETDLSSVEAELTSELEFPPQPETNGKIESLEPPEVDSLQATESLSETEATPDVELAETEAITSDNFDSETASFSDQSSSESENLLELVTNNSEVKEPESIDLLLAEIVEPERDIEGDSQLPLTSSRTENLDSESALTETLDEAIDSQTSPEVNGSEIAEDWPLTERELPQTVMPLAHDNSLNQEPETMIVETAPLENQATPSAAKVEKKAEKPKDPYTEFLKESFNNIFNQMQLKPLQRQFLKVRWLDQLLYMEKRAGHARSWYYKLRLTTIIGGVMIPALVSLNINNQKAATALRWLTFGASQLVAICAAVEEFYQYGERWRHYRRTSESLKTQLWQFSQLSGTYQGFSTHEEAFTAFASQVEDVIQKDVEVYASQVVQEKKPEKEKEKEKETEKDQEAVDDSELQASDPRMPGRPPGRPPGRMPGRMPEEEMV